MKFTFEFDEARLKVSLFNILILFTILARKLKQELLGTNLKQICAVIYLKTETHLRTFEMNSKEKEKFSDAETQTDPQLSGFGFDWVLSSCATVIK